MTGLPYPDDATWFRNHPEREFRCRTLTAFERAENDDEPPAEGLVRLAYVRRRDQATAMVWTPNPAYLLAERDDMIAERVAQVMPDPPAFPGPVESIDFDAIAAPVEASVRALADDALARGAITEDRRRAIHAEPEIHVLPQIDISDRSGAGPAVRISAKINPAFLAEIGLPERQS